MQAITTRFIGPTNTRGSRYKATCEAGSLTVSADDRLNLEENHKAVARALILKMGWIPPHYGDWYMGAPTSGGYVFVSTVYYARVIL